MKCRLCNKDLIYEDIRWCNVLKIDTQDMICIKCMNLTSNYTIDTIEQDILDDEIKE